MPRKGSLILWVLTLLYSYPAFANCSDAFSSEGAIRYDQLGFFRVAAISPKVDVGNPQANAGRVIAAAKEADRQKAKVILFPELYLSGYTAQDLLQRDVLLDETVSALNQVRTASEMLAVTIVVGAPYRTGDGRLYNAAFVIQGGQIRGAKPKVHLPNYGKFYENRWFVSGRDVNVQVADPILGHFTLSDSQIFKLGSALIGIEICEEMYATDATGNAYALAGANVILNPSGSPQTAFKSAARLQKLNEHSDTRNTAEVYVSSGPSEDSTDLVFSGHIVISVLGRAVLNNRGVTKLGESHLSGSALEVTDLDIGSVLHHKTRNMTDAVSPRTKRITTVELPDNAEATSSLRAAYSKTPFLPTDPAQKARYLEEVLAIQAHGLAQRVRSSNAKSMIFGMSGGSDSTLAAIVINEAVKLLQATEKAEGQPAYWDNSHVVGITLPGPGTSKGEGSTLQNSIALIQAFGFSIKEIDIGVLNDELLRALDYSVTDDKDAEKIVFQNAQARIRTLIDFTAANIENGFMVGTSDLSEIWLGWSTYAGDHMSGYNPNGSIPKTMVLELIAWYRAHFSEPYPNLNSALARVLGTTISPELLPAQFTGGKAQSSEGRNGPYILHDFFLYHFFQDGMGPIKLFAIAKETFKGQFLAVDIVKWLEVFFRRGFSAQFKRDVMPAGALAIDFSLSPRGDWRMPSNASVAPYLREIEQIKSRYRF